jgi:hypothetical protein
MKRTGAKYIRVMSFKPGDDEFKTPPEVFRRVKDVTNMFWMRVFSPCTRTA